MNEKFVIKSRTCTKNFENEYYARDWVKRFQKVARKLKKVSYIIILDKFKKVEYKIVEPIIKERKINYD